MSNKSIPTDDYTRYENYVKEILTGIKKLILILPLENRKVAARTLHDTWYELETEIQQEIHQNIRNKRRGHHTKA